jgi:hypothetical protein
MGESRQLITYNLPLTLGEPTKAVLILPADLTATEAERLKHFIDALADGSSRSRDRTVDDQLREAKLVRDAVLVNLRAQVETLPNRGLVGPIGGEGTRRYGS